MAVASQRIHERAIMANNGDPLTRQQQRFALMP
jgi:hypothetical protein